MADGREVSLRDDVPLSEQGHRLMHGRIDAFRTFERHTLRALEEQEVP